MLEWSKLLNTTNFFPVDSAMQIAASEMSKSLRSAWAGAFESIGPAVLAPSSLVADWLAIDLFNTKSRASDFSEVEAPPSSYSSRLTSPGDYFAESEAVIESMDDLHGAITRLTDKAQAVSLVWRGQQNADWALHSSLFRALSHEKGVQPPGKAPTGVQPYPTEDDMVRAETAILSTARETWRYEDLSALEIFARLQHHGAPTRLLDVSRNPYIAAWFAVEAHDQEDHSDARLFALATAAVPRANETPRPTRLVGALASLYQPFWHGLETKDDRQAADWGTGASRRVWVPPEYDPRIAAQNAGFVLDGVPIVAGPVRNHFRTADGHQWTKADLLASASIYARTYVTTRKPPLNRAGLAPTFSFRIVADAKAEIRTMLERWFGYGRATIYPDIGGLAQHIKGAFGEIVSG